MRNTTAAGALLAAVLFACAASAQTPDIQTAAALTSWPDPAKPGFIFVGVKNLTQQPLTAVVVQAQPRKPRPIGPADFVLSDFPFDPIAAGGTYTLGGGRSLSQTSLDTNPSTFAVVGSVGKDGTEYSAEKERAGILDMIHQLMAHRHVDADEVDTFLRSPGPSPTLVGFSAAIAIVEPGDWYRKRRQEFWVFSVQREGSAGLDGKVVWNRK